MYPEVAGGGVKISRHDPPPGLLRDTDPDRPPAGRVRPAFVGLLAVGLEIMPPFPEGRAYLVPGGAF